MVGVWHMDGMMVQHHSLTVDSTLIAVARVRVNRGICCPRIFAAHLGPAIQILGKCYKPG